MTQFQFKSRILFQKYAIYIEGGKFTDNLSRKQARNYLESNKTKLWSLTR